MPRDWLDKPWVLTWRGEPCADSFRLSAEICSLARACSWLTRPFQRTSVDVPWHVFRQALF